jgi:phenylalanyl-tRNA synthetase beta chain
MKFTLSWLKEHLLTDASLEEIVESLNSLGLVVDSVQHPGKRLTGFKIVSVLEAAPHPDADRLKVLTVDTGSEKLQVVCGGANARQGMKGVLALPGFTIPSNGMVMKIAAVRGVESHGMMCSEQELELAETSDGIIELPDEAPVGTDFAVYAGLDDPILDVEITPNRGDCLGVRGIARDLAATQIGALKELNVPVVSGMYKSPITVTLEPSQACSYFTGRFIRGLTNRESPQWLQKKLKGIGIRPISALVDITNFICFDRGRPMHVFDADKLKGNLTVRNAKPNETLLALNAKTYDLETDMTIVADSHGPVALGGIIGGLESGAQLETQNVFLECALFDPISITMTGRKAGIITDSRYRLERGVDPAIIDECLEQATQLILDICGGEPSEIVQAGHLTDKTKTIVFDFKRVASLGGLNLPEEESRAILEKLGCRIAQNEIRTPSWRKDLEGSADLVEEILRVKGYDAIPPEDLPAPSPDEELSDNSAIIASQKRRWIAKRALASCGYNEAFTWSFLSEKQAKLFQGGQSAFKIENPISADLSDMRPSLLPNLLSAITRNVSRGLKNSSLFETGHQFQNTTQTLMVTAVRTGDAISKQWLESQRSVDFFDIKADILTLLASLGVEASTPQLIPEAPSWYHPGRSASLKLGPKITLASFGELHPALLKEFDLETSVVAFECYIESIPLPKKDFRKKPLFLSPYQIVERDFAFVLDQSLSAEKLLSGIRKVDQHLIKEIRIFDVYQGPGVPEGKKSIAISIRLEPQEATLTEVQISDLSDKIISAAQQIGAQLRL